EVPAGLVPPSLRVDAPAVYPAELQESGLNGEVLLILLVDAEGNVEDVAIEASPHPALSDAAVEAARQLAFAPATLDGSRSRSASPSPTSSAHRPRWKRPTSRCCTAGSAPRAPARSSPTRSCTSRRCPSRCLPNRTGPSPSRCRRESTGCA